MGHRDLEDLAQALERMAYALEAATALVEALAGECGVTLPVATGTPTDLDDIDSIAFSQN